MPRKASDKADKHKNAGDGRDNAVDLPLSQLVKKAAAKDPVAMAALFERTNRHLYYYAYMLTGDSADAEGPLAGGLHQVHSLPRYASESGRILFVDVDRSSKPAHEQCTEKQVSGDLTGGAGF